MVWGTGTCKDGAMHAAFMSAHFLRQNEGWKRNRNFGWAKKASGEDASCGKGMLGSNVLPEGADLPALRRSFPRGAKMERRKKHPPKINLFVRERTFSFGSCLEQPGVGVRDPAMFSQVVPTVASTSGFPPQRWSSAGSVLRRETSEQSQCPSFGI